jgi:tetratricopeptide (TPR) repeat protein
MWLKMIMVMSNNMKTRLFIFLIAFTAIGNYCLGQNLKPEKGTNGKWGYIDKTGKVIVPHKYDNAYWFVEGIAIVELNKKMGYIDETGKVFIPVKYDRALYFHEGLAAVKLNGKWGYIDKTDKVIIPFKYDETGYFSEGLAAVKLNGKWGYIDKTGKVIIPFRKYDRAEKFDRGFAEVESNGQKFRIDKKGNEIGIICIQFDKTEHDFGEIQAENEKVSCEFTFTNVSQAPFNFNKEDPDSGNARIQSSCGCLSWEIKGGGVSKLFKQGEKGAIIMTMNTKHYMGNFTKYAWIYVNGTSNAKITVKGEVVKTQNAKTVLAQADSLSKAKNYTEAIVLLEKNIPLFETDSVYDLSFAYNRLGNNYYDVEDYGQAKTYYLKYYDFKKPYLESNPAQYAYWYSNNLSSLARIYEKLFDYQAAIRIYKENIELIERYKEYFENYSSDLAGKYGNLSYFYLFSKEYSLAEQSAQKALSIDSTKTWVKTNLAPALLFQGKVQEAETLYNELAQTVYRDNVTYAATILEDFEQLEKAKVIPQNMEKDIERIKARMSKIREQ